MKTTPFLALLTVMGVSGCNTAGGAAKDVNGGTTYVARKALGSGEKDK